MCASVSTSESPTKHFPTAERVCRACRSWSSSRSEGSLGTIQPGFDVVQVQMLPHGAGLFTFVVIVHMLDRPRKRSKYFAMASGKLGSLTRRGTGQHPLRTRRGPAASKSAKVALTSQKPPETTIPCLLCQKLPQTPVPPGHEIPS